MSISNALAALDCWAWRIEPDSRRLRTLEGTSPFGRPVLTWRDALRMCSAASRRDLMRAVRALRGMRTNDARRWVVGVEVLAAAGLDLQFDLLIGRDFAGSAAGAWIGLATRHPADAPAPRLPGASADQLALALEAAGAGWWSLDRRTRRVTLSGPASRLLGYGDDGCSIPIAAWMSRASPNDYPRWWQCMESLLAGRIASCDVELWDEQPDPALPRFGVRISAAVTPGQSTIVGLVQPLAAPPLADAWPAPVPAPSATAPALDREELVREIHHRIKNHLQGMTGLVERYRNDYPALGPALDAIGGQLHSIGTVYGLLARSGRGDLALDEIARAVADGLSGIAPHGIEAHFPNSLPEWHIAESFCVSVALLINELVMNAIKHSAVSADNLGVSVEGESTSTGYLLRICNPGRLPERFDFASGAGAQTGLQLVRAMLPSRGATLTFRAVEGGVEVELHLQPPVLVPSVQRGSISRLRT